jgi:hypothetical protein
MRTLIRRRRIAKQQRHAAALDDTCIDFRVYSISRKTISEKWPMLDAGVHVRNCPARRSTREALALRIENKDSAFIRVKNSEGATVVRTGVTTALISIEKCSCVACPLKRELERRVSAGASRRN